MLRSIAFAAFSVLLSCGCSSDAASPSSDPGTGGAPSGGVFGGGGAAGIAQGGAVTSGGGVVGAGGAPVPPGQLVCGGKQCHAGGACDKNGGCPAFLGDCFGNDDHYDTCDGYCSQHGYQCAPQACGPDGNAYAGSGFTWTSFSQNHAATCATSVAPDHSGTSDCGTVVFLSLTATDVVRCCCAG